MTLKDYWWLIDVLIDDILNDNSVNDYLFEESLQLMTFGKNLITASWPYKYLMTDWWLNWWLPNWWPNWGSFAITDGWEESDNHLMTLECLISDLWLNWWLPNWWLFVMDDLIDESLQLMTSGKNLITNWWLWKNIDGWLMILGVILMTTWWILVNDDLIDDLGFILVIK